MVSLLHKLVVFVASLMVFTSSPTNPKCPGISLNSLLYDRLTRLF